MCTNSKILAIAINKVGSNTKSSLCGVCLHFPHFLCQHHFLKWWTLQNSYHCLPRELWSSSSLPAVNDKVQLITRLNLGGYIPSSSLILSSSLECSPLTKKSMSLSRICSVHVEYNIICSKYSLHIILPKPRSYVYVHYT